MTITRRGFGYLTAGIGAAFALPAAAGETTARVHGVSAFGDLKYPAGFTHFDYARPDAPKGGMFSSRGTGASSTFDSLNPLILKGEPAQGILQFTLDSLLASAADEPDAAYGLLAAWIEYPEDRVWTRFGLRPEARFSDGSPVTAADVKWSFDTIVEKGSPQYRVLFRDIREAVVEDSHTILFRFDPDRPTRDMPMLAGAIPALSSAQFETRDFAESSLDPLLGSGPYIVEDADPGRAITFRRRADYWGRDLPVNLGRWNFERIRYEYFRDHTAAFEAFKAGAFTFHEEFFSKIWATGYNFPAIQSGAVKRESIPDDRTAGTQGWWFNMRRAKFQDPRVRLAISLGFDFEWSNEVLFSDLYTRTDSFFEGGPMQAEGKPSPGELRYLEPLADMLPEGVLDAPAFTPPVTDGSGRNRRNLRQAARLLDAAGWTVQDGQRRNAAGEALSFEVLGSSPAFARIVNPFLQNLERIGIQATFRQIDHAQYQERVKRFDFDITGARFAMQLTPGTELRNIFGSEAADIENSFNLCGLKDPAVDALLDAVMAADSREELTNAVKALDRVLRALHLWIPNWHKGEHNIAYWDIFDRPEVKPKYARGVIDLWWVDRAKYDALSDQIRG